MSKINCGNLNPHYGDLLKTIRDWAGTKKTRSQLSDPYEAAFRLAKKSFMNDFNYLMYDYKSERLTEGSLKSFKDSLKELNNRIDSGTLDSDFASFFYLSKLKPASMYGRQEPVTAKYLDDMQKSSFTFRNNEITHRSFFKKILKSLEDEGKLQGLSARYGLKNAKRYIQKLDNDLAKAINAKDDGEISRINGEMKDLVDKTYLKVFDDFIDVIEKRMPEAVMTKYNSIKKKADEGNKNSQKLISKYDEGISILRLNRDEMASLVRDKDGKVLSPNMYKALADYNEMSEGLYKVMQNGTKATISSIVNRLEITGDVDSSSRLKEIGKRLEANLMPKYKDGFFPHYVRDLSAPFMDTIMPHLDDLNTATNPYVKTKGRTVNEILDGLNTRVTEHTKGRAEEGDYTYSRNFLNVMSSYIFDVNRFNYAAFMDKHFVDALGSVESIYRKNGNTGGFAQNVVDYIQDLHGAANGDTNISPKTRAFMRTLLGFEFISKLGVNPRAAARNFTQRLLDYVEWGPVMVNRMNKELKTMQFTDKTGKSIDSESYIQSVLKDAGLLFEEVSPELLESGLQEPASLFKMRRWNEEKGKFEIIEKSGIEKGAELVSSIAAKSSWLHRKAENSNRQHTFKVAYAQLHNWLSDNPAYRKQKADEGQTPDQINNRIRTVAENYAKSMVILNHFDYADYAKSKALRHPIGRFLGQFQHYTFEFFERNIRIAKEAKGDILMGKLMPGSDARGLQKAYRMALAYFMAPMVAAYLTGVNWSNIIEHDSWERLKQLFILMTGDDEEIKAAFYGKGPIISTFGGAVTSDALEIGQMLDLINLDDPSYLTMITGLEKYDDDTSTDVGRKIGLLNTFAGRAWDRYLPEVRKGRIGWAAQSELGFYPTKRARQAQKKEEPKARAVPYEIEKALSLLT